ncbi:hypothetical protein [Leptospira idonii]|uniref:Uncharacterized protein n=1 Tax=Leptospira idonii TaxID=1193500 RepID=A0A4V3JXV1_9LEPT|nr:hypothetical protein [Leptospira idonii]TGN18576.1 hypothetical protein EHS15_14425 [Leptospira idonii]
MKAKVAHLFKKLEEIERDSVELKKLTDRIADDREYSPFLKESFLSEMQNLDEQKKEILKVSVSTAGSERFLEKGKKEVPTETNAPSDSSLPEKKKTEKNIRKY